MKPVRKQLKARPPCGIHEGIDHFERQCAAAMQLFALQKNPACLYNNTGKQDQSLKIILCIKQNIS